MKMFWLDEAAHHRHKARLELRLALGGAAAGLFALFAFPAAASTKTFVCTDRVPAVRYFRISVVEDGTLH